MSNLLIAIDCSNDAFGFDPAAEVARILRELANRIEKTGSMDGLILRDSNGNSVGAVSWERGE